MNLTIFNTENNGLPLIRIRDVVRGYSDTFYDAEYNDGCYLIFGKETKGLSKEILEKYPEGMVRIPMVNEDRIRSLNLSNSVAVAVYEAIRQIGPENMR